MEKQYIFEAKHTKDSKDLACSTLSLWHLSRAFTLENHRWVRGTHFTDERSKLTNCRNFKKIFLDFSFLFFFLSILDTACPIFGHGVPKIAFGHEAARRRSFYGVENCENNLLIFFNFRIMIFSDW